MYGSGSRERLHVAALLLVAAVLRLFTLGEESLWTDELLTLMFVQRWSGLELAVALPQAQPHLPVYYLLLDAWVVVAGTGEFALRFPSAVFGVAAVGVIYAVGREVGGHGVGLLAGAMLAVSKFHLRYSQEVRMYSLLTLLALASVYLLLRLRRAPSRRTALGFGLVTVVLLYTHPFAAFIVLAEVVWVAVGLSRRERPLEAGRVWVGAFAPVGLAVLPMVLALALRVGGGVSYSFIPLPTPTTVALMLPAYLGYNDGPYLLLYFLALVCVCGLALLGTTGRGRVGRPPSPLEWLRPLPTPRDERVLLALVFLAALGLPVVVSYLVTPVFTARYTIAASIPFFVLVALGVRRLEPSSLRYAVAALVVLTMLPTLGPYYTETQKEEWDAAGAYVEERAEPGDLVLVADQISLYGAEHYVTRPDVRVRGLVTEASGTGYEPASNATVAETVGGEDRVWLMLSHLSDAEADRIRAVVGEGRTLSVEREYHGVTLLLYTTGNETENATDVGLLPSVG
jgi:4-amino-4-deoxy-L-arabinose transferase-like glycosyltransferase